MASGIHVWGLESWLPPVGPKLQKAVLGSLSTSRSSSYRCTCRWTVFWGAFGRILEGSCSTFTCL